MSLPTKFNVSIFNAAEQRLATDVIVEVGRIPKDVASKIVSQMLDSIHHRRLDVSKIERSIIRDAFPSRMTALQSASTVG